MRSAERWIAAATLCLASTLATAQAASPPALSASAVMAAASAVEADPLMPGTEKSKTLRLKQDDSKPPEKQDVNAWLNLLDSISTGLRVAMWLVFAGLLIWVLLRLRDWLGRPSGEGALVAVPPTHVGTLDIRPESLPADIGGAALALWQRGQARAALSLLYRGALSRLAHGHGVPIRAASTERECLSLAQPRLAPPALAYLAQLVAGWQTVAYAQRPLAEDTALALCAGFDAQLPARGDGGGA